MSETQFTIATLVTALRAARAAAHDERDILMRVRSAAQDAAAHRRDWLPPLADDVTDWRATMKRTVLLAVLAALLTSAHAANDAPPVRMLAANCANCHGTTGRASGAMPSLAGVNKDYLVEQMLQFREGKRPATVMHQLAMGYRDEEIALLAEFFARQPK